MFFSVFLPSYYRFQPITSSYSLLHFFPSIVAHSSPSSSVSSGPCCWLSHFQRKSTRLIAVSLLINFSLQVEASSLFTTRLKSGGPITEIGEEYQVGPTFH